MRRTEQAHAVGAGRLAHVGVFLVAALTCDSLFPALASAAINPPPTRCQPASGTIRDPKGAPLAGVYVNAAVPGDVCENLGTATTDPNGDFRVYVNAAIVGGPNATASRPGYISAQRNVALLVSNDMVLQYDLRSTLTPPAVRAGQAVTVTGQTTANPSRPPAGYVCAAGDDGSGQLGDGAGVPNANPPNATWATTPVAVSGLGGSGSLAGVSSIAAGDAYGLALKTDGTVLASGSGWSGELGTNSVADQPTPVFVAGVGGSGRLAGMTSVAASTRTAWRWDQTGR